MCLEVVPGGTAFLLQFFLKNPPKRNQKQMAPNWKNYPRLFTGNLNPEVLGVPLIVGNWNWTRFHFNRCCYNRDGLLYKTKSYHLNSPVYTHASLLYGYSPIPPSIPAQSKEWKGSYFAIWQPLVRTHIQSVNSRCSQPPVDIKIKVPF